MNRDPQLLVSIQIALMGIVLVVGFFFVWRAISRIEARLDELSSRECRDINNAACMMATNNMTCEDRSCDSSVPMYVRSSGMGMKVNNKYDEEDKDEEDEEEIEDDMELMKACFGDIPMQSLIDQATANFMIFKTNEMYPDKESESEEEVDTGVVIEELHENTKMKSDKVDTIAIDNNEEEGSVGGTEANEYSRTKLRKMNLDSLKDICVSRGLTTEGTKAALMDRILSSLPSN
jgi:hypothetical protein